MTMAKRLTAAFFALLFSLSLICAWPCAAGAEKPPAEINRFNVVLVVDKSGSLCDAKGSGTDPNGLRFDAMRLFLGLLTESGNHVGAIVFDEEIRYDSGMLAMNSMDDKKALIREVEAFSPGYDTDIGGAVLRATELLEGMREDNGLPCMILLLTDGRTDFSIGDTTTRMVLSWEKAKLALNAAKEQGITINGILLNVDGKVTDAETEFQIYTKNTRGTFEEVGRPEDLAAAFKSFYNIINNTRYTGAQKIAFSDAGTADIDFAVPNFGVEEVNIVVEHETEDEDVSLDEIVGIDVIRPNGSSYDVAGRELVSSRYIFVKIPHPEVGQWNVRLEGVPEDWVDVTMVYNASMSLLLSCEVTPETYRTYTPYCFWVDVVDPAVPHVTEEQLKNMRAVLLAEELSTGEVHEYALEAYGDDTYSCELRFYRSGEYALTAQVGMNDFVVLSDPMEITVEIEPLAAKVPAVTDMLQYGRFVDDHWELELGELFNAGVGSGVDYTLSDDLDGALTIEDGVLQARFSGTDTASFTVTATDAAGQEAEVSFDLVIPAVAAKVKKISNMINDRDLDGEVWELDLNELFEDPKECALEYTLSDDYDGLLTIEDDVLQAHFREMDEASFTVTATDIFGLQAEVPVELKIPSVYAKVKSVDDMLKIGSFHDHLWEVELSELFEDPKGCAIEYALSDDYDGALSIADDKLQMDISALKEASFTLTASDVFGLHAEIPFDLKVPGPIASGGGITETVKTGLFQDGTLVRKISGMFRDPKGSRLSYSVTDDFGGAARIVDGTLEVNCKGLGKVEFAVKATDEFGLSAEIPVNITEKNMTMIYAMWAAGGLLTMAALSGLIVWLRRR